MKVIFLDIDGVLNSEQWGRSIDDNWEAAGGHFFIDPSAVKLLVDVCKQTDAKIVISSSWRSYTLSQTLKEFSTYRDFADMIPFIVGITPYSFFDRVKRGVEIQQYLASDDSITNYVIVDDYDDMLDEQMQFFVQTDDKVGLTKKDCEKMINILNFKN